MNLPSVFDKFLPQKKVEKEIFSSMVLDREYAAAALWEMGDKGIPKVLAAESRPTTDDSWEARLDAVDESLAAVEDVVGTTTYAKVVLGLPSAYLTPEGEILKEVRPEIKTITRELELKPIGFVSLPSAILYRLKKEEGVPPSVILLHITKKTITTSLYRVGALIGESVHDRTSDTAISLEESLKAFKNLEVLPARILLYGSEVHDLEEVKTELLRYPWTTRVNFLHFPKIEILSSAETVSAVSLAGASEISHEVVQEEEPLPEEIAAEAEVEAEAVEEQQEIEEEESNVVAVDPANLGFKKNVDVLEEVQTPAKAQMKLPAVALPHIDFAGIQEKIHLQGTGPIIGIGIVLLFIIGFLYWFMPHATVTVLTLPKTLTAAETITIDPSATTVDAQNNVIPGAAQQKSVSGTKTIPVTGKKDVGNPAKGVATVYNKSPSSDLSLPKGTQLTSGSLTFTTDSDADIASASTTISDTGGSTTFGTGTVNITASQIGTGSNLAAGTSFSIQGYSADLGVARNPAALSGGTSKTVTVVSRADEDAFVKAVSGDLVDKAKQDLSGSISGSQKLIDETIATTVTQKKFDQELDQESTSLSGSATITVSGTSYNQDDVATLMKAAITGQIPATYALSEGRTQVTLANVKVGKDGKITAKATITTAAVPTLNTAEIQNQLAGKTITAAEVYLKRMNGVSGIEVHFGFTISKNMLPVNAKNITVTVATQ